MLFVRIRVCVILLALSVFRYCLYFFYFIISLFLICLFFCFFFFFSSRRRHTRLTCDWSSDVCSSDLKHWCWRPAVTLAQPAALQLLVFPIGLQHQCFAQVVQHIQAIAGQRQARVRSEERRVGKECRSRGAPDH